MQVLIFVIVIVTALGIVFQCLSNQRARHVQFLSFPIALLIQFPYPMWALMSWLKGNATLLAISLCMGLPSAWLSAQYFRYHGMPEAGSWKIEERMAILLVVTGVAYLFVAQWLSGLVQALAGSAAYFTCVIALFSYLVKIARVASGSESLEGLRWPTLLMLFVFYGAMLSVGARTDVPLLYLAYVFSILACGLAILYKGWLALMRPVSKI